MPPVLRPSARPVSAPASASSGGTRSPITSTAGPKRRTSPSRPPATRPELQQEQRQHALEGIDEDGVDRRRAHLARQRADDQAAEQQQHALAEQHVVRERAPACAGRVLLARLQRASRMPATRPGASITATHSAAWLSWAMPRRASSALATAKVTTLTEP
jgi:hypothetical protein